MWPFKKKSAEEILRAYKTVKINGMKFKIRKLNPLLDFPENSIPQIFTSTPARAVKEAPITEKDAKRSIESLYDVIRAGVVDPVIVAEGKDGIKASDLFRDPTMGPKLYIEIVSHSLNTFKGLKGLFFFHRIKLSLWMSWLKDMGERRQALLSQMEA